MANNHSAEWLRGAVEVLGMWGSSHYDSIQDALANYRALLAAAEAREATQPTAAEVIEACDEAITELCELAESNGEVFDYQVESRTEHARAFIARYKEANGGK